MLAILLALSGATAPAADSAGQPMLRFCLAAHNLPFSTSHPPWGIDGELARQIGAGLGRETDLVWIDEEEETPEEALRQGRCDAAMGAIVEADGLARPSSVPGLALSSPYYTAGYLLVHKPGLPSPARLEETGGSRIAVEMISIPIYTLKQRGLSVYALDDTEAVISAVADGRARYGYVWGPVGSWLVRERDDVVLANGFVPKEVWSFAIATRAGETELLEGINSAVGRLLRTGVVRQTFSRYGVPYLPPKSLSASRSR